MKTTTQALAVKTVRRRMVAGVMLLTSTCVCNAANYTFFDLRSPNASDARAFAVNNAGQVVGDGGAARALLWNGGSSPITDLGGSQATGINGSGQIVGNSWNIDAGGVYTEFGVLWSGGTTTNLGSNLYVTGINNAGAIVGTVSGGPGAHGAALWNSGALASLGSLVASGSSSAGAINDAGVVAGSSITASGYQHATVWSAGAIIDLGTLGGTDSWASGINDAGQVVGYARTASQARHATVWNGLDATDLGVPWGDESIASDINNMGQVVGAGLGAINPHGKIASHALLWSNGTTTDLNSFLDESFVSAGWVLYTAYGINDNGWIVGEAYNTVTEASHGFLLVPVPELSTTCTLLIGLGWLGTLSSLRGRRAQRDEAAARQVQGKPLATSSLAPSPKNFERTGQPLERRTVLDLNQ